MMEPRGNTGGQDLRRVHGVAERVWCEIEEIFLASKGEERP